MNNWFSNLNDKFKDDPEYLQERIEDLYDEIRSLQDRLAAVETERDEYKDEFIELATAYWELRRTLIYKLAETALREAAKEG